MECPKCKEIKQACDFYKSDRTCKDCRKQMVRDNRARNYEYYKAFDKARANNPNRVLARFEYQKTDAGKAAANRARKKFLLENPVKRAAHIILGNAVRDGKVIKSKQCCVCGVGGRIHGHHDDYALPLVVRWMCCKCHMAWHKDHGEGLNA